MHLLQRHTQAGVNSNGKASQAPHTALALAAAALASPRATPRRTQGQTAPSSSLRPEAWQHSASPRALTCLSYSPREAGVTPRGLCVGGGGGVASSRESSPWGSMVEGVQGGEADSLNEGLGLHGAHTAHASWNCPHLEEEEDAPALADVMMMTPSQMLPSPWLDSARSCSLSLDTCAFAAAGGDVSGGEMLRFLQAVDESEAHDYGVASASGAWEEHNSMHSDATPVSGRHDTSHAGGCVLVKGALPHGAFDE